MREAKIVVDMIQSELLPQPLFTLTQRADPSSDRRHMLANRKVNALNKRRIDLPAAGRQHLLDRLQRAEHDPVMHANQPPPAHGLHHLRIEQVGQWHPARLRCRALRPPSGGCIHCPKCVSTAVMYSRKPSVRKSGTQSGANTCAT